MRTKIDDHWAAFAPAISVQSRRDEQNTELIPGYMYVPDSGLSVYIYRSSKVAESLHFHSPPTIYLKPKIKSQGYIEPDDGTN